MDSAIDRSELMLPRAYHAFDQEGHSMVGNKNSEYLLKDRTFVEIDSYFSESISKTIAEMSNKYPGRQIQILDIAGGAKSQAVRDIGRSYGNRVKAVNLDIVQNIKEGTGALRVQGDAVSIPFASSSIDIVYCRQFLPFLERFRREHGSQVGKVLLEVARVLRPGGVAFLDDEEELSGPKSSDKRIELATRLGVVLQTSNSRRAAWAERNFPDLWHRSIRPEQFLVMRKPYSQ